ncbi:MAG: hypothetical protein K9L79_01560 [Methylobacter tundripaludum]|nr:hypothetical protein [Methylobacter tundripaludum]
MTLQQRLIDLAEAIAQDIAALEQRNTSIGNTSNIIAVDTTIAAGTSYIVMDMIDVSATLTVNGYLGVL